MLIVDCPWCDAPVALESDTPRCDDCAIELGLEEDVPAVALAA